VRLGTALCGRREPDERLRLGRGRHSVVEALPLPVNAGAEAFCEPRQPHRHREQEPEGESLTGAVRGGRPCVGELEGRRAGRAAATGKMVSGAGERAGQRVEIILLQIIFNRLLLGGRMRFD
jgi:hypothetical protein